MEDNSLAVYYFHQGTNYEAYKYLGCNMKRNGVEYVYSFRTWAPGAHSVELISDFNGWDNPIPLTRINNSGIWELIYTSQKSIEKNAYKFKVTSSKGSVNKGDPYARFSRGLGDGASLVFCESRHKWSDGNWMRHRRACFDSNKAVYLSTPVNIYEVHLESFLKHDDNTNLSYRELADTLSAYCKTMGFTHVELLPIMEYPYSGSWGYQVCGFYAPTSRFGDPDDFRYFVDTMHRSGIGVILDWVPAHFPKDEWGLYEFDGSPLYEYQGKDRQESRSWGTRFFDLGREEIQSFLISNALYYFREFHVDGLRVDAVASMLYLDYDRDDGEWIPNQYGTNINLESIAFFKKLNNAISKEYSDVLMIAEESTSIGIITKPVSCDGLGFSMKWNMGWANDFYEYLALDPIARKYHHKALNFPLMYAFSENYCLPISHDEVVHGKKSLIDKMFGSYEDKFRQMKIALLLMMTYPGKKLMFMGCEFAQFREWDYNSSLEWFMLDYPSHHEMREYVRALNHLYLSSRELWEMDFIEDGFSWIFPDENEKNLVAYRRISKSGSTIISVINFSGADQTIDLPLTKCNSVEVIFSTDISDSTKVYQSVHENSEYYISLTVKRFSGLLMKEKNGKKTIRI